MRRWTSNLLGAAILAVLLAGTATAQQPRSSFYTTPLPPPRQVLDRLNLQMAWRTYVPMDGRRDGLASVQLHGTDVYVQTRSGLVALIDAENGVLRWKTRVGQPYVTLHGLAFNSREVYVVNNTYLYALDKRSGAATWRYRLPEGVSTTPIADESMIFIPTQSSRLTAYYLPRPDVPVALAGGMTTAYDDANAIKAKMETEEERRKRIPSVKGERQLASTTVSHLTPSVRDVTTEMESTGPKPVRVWSAVTSLRLDFPVMHLERYLVLPTPNGIVATFSTLPRTDGMAAEIYRFPTKSALHVAPAYFDGMVYIAAENANLYALQISSNQVQWRYTSGVAASRKPTAVGDDIFLVAARKGMTRLDRATGAPMWRVPVRDGLAESNTAADRFLAVNPKYVYAADASGRLLVLERRRGVTLSGYDFKNFVYPVPNEITDRLYLAANNGLIVCLHDRDYPQPIRYRKLEEDAENPVLNKLKAPMKMEEKPNQTLQDLLDSWTKRMPPLKFRIAENAFRRAGRPSPAAKTVKVPPLDDGKSIGEVLEGTLKSIQCVFDVIGDTIVIIPGAPAK